MSPLTKWNPFRTANEVEDWNALSRGTPFHALERMQEQMNRLFQANGGEAMTVSQWTPSVDISEDDKEFLVKAELPEVKKEDVKVTVGDGVLSIRGERKSEKEEKNKKFHRLERSYGSFERSFTLPDGTDAGKITSEVKDGVLTVHLPKNPAAKPNSIEIKVQ